VHQAVALKNYLNLNCYRWIYINTEGVAYSKKKSCKTIIVIDRPRNIFRS